MTDEASVRSSAGLRQLGHVPALDGLRGLAVLLVLLSHTQVLVPGGPTGVSIIDNVFRGGFLGVDLFFVLSGFLISALLLGEESQSGRVRFGAFYARRALRLLPALIALLAVHVMYVLIAGLPTTTEWPTVWSALFYYFNWQFVWNFQKINSDLGHLWSLSIEEQFYILWPIVLMFGLSIRRGALAASSLLISTIAVVSIRRHVMWDDGVACLILFMRTDTRIDALLIGALLASVWVRRCTPSRGVPQAAWISVAGLVLCLGFVKPEDSFLYRGGFTLVATLFAVLVLAVIDRAWSGGRFFTMKPLRAIGKVSYGLYLWHLPVFFAFQRHAGSWPPALRLTGAVGVTASLTLLSWYLIERPALRLKDRLSDNVAPRAAH